MIGVPRQDSKCGGKQYFTFLIKKIFVLEIPMKIGVNFMFSAFFLTHRQENTGTDLPELFINFASFLNTKLCSCIQSPSIVIQCKNRFPNDDQTVYLDTSFLPHIVVTIRIIILLLFDLQKHRIIFVCLTVNDIQIPKHLMRCYSVFLWVIILIIENKKHNLKLLIIDYQ